METQGRYADLSLVDSTMGSRLVFGFRVPDVGLRRRMPHPMEPSSSGPPEYVAALGPEPAKLPPGPNLFVVFNDLLHNQDDQGRPQADVSARYVGFNIPSRNTATGEHGMVHFRIFTGHTKAVPGRYRDALPAQVKRQYKAAGNAASTVISDNWQIESDAGGRIDLEFAYERGALTRITAAQPNFPVWAAADPSILRVYQEDMLFELIRLYPSINRVRRMTFRIMVPELTDIPITEDALVLIFANPLYTRRVFSPRPKPMAGNGPVTQDVAEN